MTFEETKYSPNIKIIKNGNYVGTISEKLVHFPMTSFTVNELKMVYDKMVSMQGQGE